MTRQQSQTQARRPPNRLEVTPASDDSAFFADIHSRFGLPSVVYATFRTRHTGIAAVVAPIRYRRWSLWGHFRDRESAGQIRHAPLFREWFALGLRGEAASFKRANTTTAPGCVDPEPVSSPGFRPACGPLSAPVEAHPRRAPARSAKSRPEFRPGISNRRLPAAPAFPWRRRGSSSRAR